MTVTGGDADRSPADGASPGPLVSAATTPSPDLAPLDELASLDPEDLAPSAAATSMASPTPAVPVIGYIALDETQAYVQDVGRGLRNAAQAAGVELLECDSGWTRAGTRACARQLAAAGVTGVVSMQPFGDLSADVCATLGDVPTVGIVYEQGPCQVSLLHVDQAESGRLAGSALGALAADRWECNVKAFLSLESGPDDPIGGARMDGFREGFREHCQLPEKKTRLDDAQFFVTARRQVEDTLDQIKGKPIIAAAVSDIAALGALEAADRAGRPNHVWAAGQLAETDARAAIACDQHFVASVAQFPERFGDLVLPVLLDAAAGMTVPARLDAELALVSAENVRELFPDTPACDA
ncbi:MAG: substrate-binding domain-containing protein [Chloroflexota bacterium]